TFTLNVPNTPDAPVIGSIPDQTTNEDVPLDILLNVSDVDTALSNLVFSAVVSNRNMVTSVTFTNTGTNVTAHVNLGRFQNGVAAVTILVSDGTSVAASTFALTVNSVPTAP